MGKAKTEIQALYPEPRQVELSVGPVWVQRFKLRQLALAGEIIARLSNCLDFDALLNGGTAAIDVRQMIYFICEHDMEMVFKLMSLATDTPPEFFWDLEIPEAFDLLEAIWDVSLKPAFEEAGAALKKKMGADNTGQTPSSDSSAPDSDTMKSET